MGLDQYLIKKTYVGGQYDHREVKGTIDVSSLGNPLPIDLKRVTYISEEIGYWRRANAIHKWFVDNVQNGKDDCGEYWISPKKLENLLDICYKVKDQPYDAPKLLPTEDGFFFGSTEYNEDYFDNLNRTIFILKSALEEANNESEFYYNSSW